MDTPSADIAVDEAVVARLIEEQHPDLASSLTLVANGWDNALYRLGDHLCVRIPRRQRAAHLIANEQRWLPKFADRVSTALPVPVRVGVPSRMFPWAWSIVPWFDGMPATELRLDARASLAADLAIFIAQLHVDASHDAPHNPVRGVPLTRRSRAVEERLASGLIPNSGELSALWSRLVSTTPWQGPPLWLHGDLHPGNLISRNRDGVSRLAAVVDFGDLTAGDPATDLAAGWLVFDTDARLAFRAALGGHGADEATWRRARGWALSMGTALAMHSDDNPVMAAAGRHVLEQVLLDEGLPYHRRP